MTERGMAAGARPVRFGVEVPHRPELLGPVATRAEALGFDSVWIGDHVAFHNPTLDSLAALSYVAALTRRVRIGPCVYLLALRHPDDRRQAGRLPRRAVRWPRRLRGRRRRRVPEGVRGGRRPAPGARGARRRGHRGLPGALGAVARLLRGPVHAVHRRRPRAEARPAGRPADLDRGPVGRRPSPGRAARRRLGLVPRHPRAVPREPRRRSRLRGRAPAGPSIRADFEPAHVLFTVVDDDRARAHATAASYLERQYKQPFDDLARKYCLLGPPAACVERLAEFVAAGVGTFVIYFTVPADAMPEQLERFGAEILPRVPSGPARARASAVAWPT